MSLTIQLILRRFGMKAVRRRAGHRAPFEESADRADKRRRDLNFLNSTGAAWEQRAQLIKYYGVRLVTFERRWQRRYSWAYQHGKLLGSAAGQDVILLDNALP